MNVAMPHLRGRWSPTKAILRTLEVLFMKAFLCCLAARHRFDQSGSPGCRCGREMKWIPQVLQFPVIINGGRPLALATSEPSETRFPLRWHRRSGTRPSGIVRAPVLWRRAVEAPVLANSNRFRLACRQPAVQDNFHAKGLEVDIPGVDHRIEERDAIFSRDVEDVCVQKL